MAETRIKVKVSDLISKMQERRQQILDKHREEVFRHAAETIEYPEHVIAALEVAIVDVKAGRLPQIGYGGSMGRHLDVAMDDKFEPKKPRTTGDTAEVDRLIASLEISAEDTLSLTKQDLNYYLGVI